MLFFLALEGPLARGVSNSGSSSLEGLAEINLHVFIASQPTARRAATVGDIFLRCVRPGARQSDQWNLIGAWRRATRRMGNALPTRSLVGEGQE